MLYRIFFILLAGLFLSTTLYALEDSKVSRIATYDRGVVTQSSVYYNIYLLSIDSKSRDILSALNQKIKETLQKLLVTEDTMLLGELQKSLKVYKKKKATVKKVLQSNRYQKQKAALDRFIESHYSKEYDVIIPNKLLYESYNGKVVLNVDKVDITERIIADIEKEIEGLD